VKRRRPSLAVVVPWAILISATALGGLFLWLNQSDEVDQQPGEVLSFDLAEGREPLPEQGRLCFTGHLTPQEVLPTHAVVDLDRGRATVGVLYAGDADELLRAEGPLVPVATTADVYDIAAEVPDPAVPGESFPVRFTLTSNRLSLPGEAILAVATCDTIADQVAVIDAAG
jgi:hypothetical protein